MYEDSKALEKAINEFIHRRQETAEGCDYAVKMTGATVEYEEQQVLREHYLQKLVALLPHNWDDLDRYLSAENAVASIIVKAEYRHGFMDAFHIFRILLNADDRRRACRCCAWGAATGCSKAVRQQSRRQSRCQTACLHAKQ